MSTGGITDKPVGQAGGIPERPIDEKQDRKTKTVATTAAKILGTGDVKNKPRPLPRPPQKLGAPGGVQEGLSKPAGLRAPPQRTVKAGLIKTPLPAVPPRNGSGSGKVTRPPSRLPPPPPQRPTTMASAQKKVAPPLPLPRPSRLVTGRESSAELPKPSAEKKTESVAEKSRLGKFSEGEENVAKVKKSALTRLGKKANKGLFQLVAFLRGIPSMVRDLKKTTHYAEALRDQVDGMLAFVDIVKARKEGPSPEDVKKYIENTTINRNLADKLLVLVDIMKEVKEHLSPEEMKKFIESKIEDQAQVDGMLALVDTLKEKTKGLSSETMREIIVSRIKEKKENIFVVLLDKDLRAKMPKTVVEGGLITNALKDSMQVVLETPAPKLTLAEAEKTFTDGLQKALGAEYRHISKKDKAFFLTQAEAYLKSQGFQ
jgi:hypothetical protein